MTQNVCVSVQMDEKSFHDFASFDLLRHNKGWQRPAVFTAILLVCAGMAGEQNKTEPTNRYTWNTVYCAYRTKEAVYIYVQKNQAYLLNESMDAAWSLLGSALPAASLHDCRK